MNVIWIVSDTFRRDHMGAYGSDTVRTPALNKLAAKSVRFDNHYAAGFPTMPTRADHFTGRWTLSYMGWEPFAPQEVTLAQILSQNGFHTAAVVDTPFYLRGGMNYDRGFQTFMANPGQEGSGAKALTKGNHESQDIRAGWRHEADRNAPKTFSMALQWLEHHYKEDFFLYIDTWDPHEPWDAPNYYTELYWPDYDGEVIDPLYCKWKDVKGFSKQRLQKAHATYCGEITMVDTWVGHLLKQIENMSLLENTVVIFTSDHGFYFGEHDGIFGKMVMEMNTDQTVPLLEDWDKMEEGGQWGYSPLYEEIARIPLLVCAPGVEPAVCRQLTSAVDLMPTVLDLVGQTIPSIVEGTSLLPKLYDPSLPGREFCISSIPFANPGDPVRSVDDFLRMLGKPTVTTVSTREWSLLYSPDPGVSKLYNLKIDPNQENNIIMDHYDIAKALHAYLVKFMQDTRVADYLVKPRLKLLL